MKKQILWILPALATDTELMGLSGLGFDIFKDASDGQWKVVLAEI